MVRCTAIRNTLDRWEREALRIVAPWQASVFVSTEVADLESIFRSNEVMVHHAPAARAGFRGRAR